MADLVTTIKLDKNQFDNSIKESTNQIRKFKSDTEKSGGSVTDFGGKMQSMAMGGIAKFAGAIGAAYTATEVFSGAIQSTQNTADAFDIVMQQAKSSVDHFFSTIATGDWSNFWDGLDGAIRRGKELATQLDELGDVLAGYSVTEIDLRNKLQDSINIIQDPNSSKAQIDEAIKIAEETQKELSRITNERVIPQVQEAIRKSFSEAAKTDDITDEDITAYWKIQLKDDEGYKEYKEERERLEKLSTDTIQVELPRGGVTNSRTAASYDAEKELELLQKQNAYLERMYQIENNIVDTKKDNIKNLVIQGKHIERNELQSERMLNRARKAAANRGKGKEIIPVGSLAYYDQRIRELNKELTLTVDPKTYKELLKQIEKLEQEKFYLQFVLDPKSVRDIEKIKFNVNTSVSTDAHNFSNTRVNSNTGLTVQAVNDIIVQSELQNLNNTLKKTQREVKDASGKDQERLRNEIKDLKTRIAFVSSNNGEGTGTVKPSILPATGSLSAGFGPTVDWSKKGDLQGYSSRLMGVLEGMKGLDEVSIRANFEVSEEQVREELEKVNTLLTDMETVEIDAKIKHLEEFQNWQGAVYDLGDAFSYLGSAMGDAEGRSMKMIGTMITGINQLLPNLITLIAAEESKAYTSAISSGAGLPFPWNIAAIAAGVAAVTANMASIPKFADGGLVYGNTIAQVGEYAGASNNPEVIAPLSKLRDILADTNSGIGSGTVDFKIAGKDLVGVINNYSHKNNKK